MTTRKQGLGRDLARGGGMPELTGIVEPKEIFVGDAAEKLYDLEARRNAAIKACAIEWGIVTKAGDEDILWTQLIPQALFDTLEFCSPQYSIIAAEAFLKQFGWKIERPGTPFYTIREVLEKIERRCTELTAGPSTFETSAVSRSVIVEFRTDARAALSGFQLPSAPIIFAEIADETVAAEYLRRAIRNGIALTIVDQLRDAHELADITLTTPHPAVQAITFACEKLDDPFDKVQFLQDWLRGDYAEWPEFLVYIGEHPSGTTLTSVEKLHLQNLANSGPFEDHDTIEDRVLVNSYYAERFADPETSRIMLRVTEAGRLRAAEQ
jgi:hypothetical protein